MGTVLREGTGRLPNAAAKSASKVARNEVLAAGRDAVMVSGRVEVHGVAFSGWTRGVAVGACPACTSLANGAVLAWSTPMVEHPSCSCVQVPTIGHLPDRHPLPNSRDLFDQLSAAQQDTIFGHARAEIIRGGGDIDFAHVDHGLVVPTPAGA
jgi:hypothetical protein